MLSARLPVRPLLLTLVAVLASVGIASAATLPARSASGTFTTTSAIFNNTRTVGSDTFNDLTATVAYTGAFTGTSTVDGLLIFHADGTANFWDIETFSGTVNGTPGTVTFYLHGTGSVVPPGIGSYHGTQTIVNATGALANLHGELNQVGTVPSAAAGPLGTYAGHLHVDGP